MKIGWGLEWYGFFDFVFPVRFVYSKVSLITLYDVCNWA